MGPPAGLSSPRAGTEPVQINFPVPHPPVDNVVKGGLVFDLDTETGRLGLGLGLGPRSKEPWDRLEVHPDSNVRISGQILTGGNKIVEKCLKLHGLLPFNSIIAWDMAIGPDDFILIEANLGSGVDILQAHGPLLLDLRLKDFYRSQSVL